MTELSLGCDPGEWRPILLNPAVEEDRNEIGRLRNEAAIMVHDLIESQVGEWLKCTQPAKKLKGDSLKAAIENFFETNDRNIYGTWVYYPWNRRLVHLLPEEEFITTRTSPNNPKITLEEQALLREKKIGVVGLSVGQSISLVLSMERICGELRIADFDTLELANLNRIRAGVHSMGINKAVQVAREIMEIDPYFKIRSFPDGLTAGNMDAFFTDGGPLDVIVDECDSIDIKIELRKKARSLGIPVVMDMSDRGTIDVERFDLEPERPILHGWIDHLDYSNLGRLSNEDKVPFMLPVFGMDTMSKKLKASMVEIGESIHTWPQLATSVALGGALAADTVRRIFLGQFRDSGRYFVDLDLLVADKKKEDTRFAPEEFSYPRLHRESMREEARTLMKAMQWSPGELEEKEVETMIDLASLAPSAGNNQPWLWLFLEGHLFLFHEKARSYSWTDIDDSLAYLGLGAAAESLRLAAGRLGYTIETAEWDQNQLVAAFRLQKTPAAVVDPLAAGLELRCTNRKKGDRAPFPAEVSAKMKEAVETVEGIHFQVFASPKEIEGIAEVLGRAEKLRFLHPQGHYEFFKDEMRWTPEQAEKTRNGLDIRTLELSVTQATGMQVASDPGVMDLVRRWQGGKALEKVGADAVRTSSAIGLIYGSMSLSGKSLKGGAALLRAWISANQQGWAVHPISAPIFFINRANSSNSLLSAENIIEIASFKRNLVKIIPLLQEEKGIFLFKLSKSDEIHVRSLRLNREDILIKG